MNSKTSAHTTRRSPVWRWAGFLIALIGVGFKYWQLSGDQAALPQALLGPGLIAVGVVAMILRAFGTGRFVHLWLLLAASVPVAVWIRHLAFEAEGAVARPLLTELGIGAGLGLIVALIGVGIGSLLLLRSSQRPD